MFQNEIDDLYAVFARYARPVRLEGCPCCTSPGQARPLISKGLRELDASELGHYAFKAMTTWGTVDDYRYFLPRILELTLEDEERHPCDTEVTLRKLAYGGFSCWGSDERSAIQNLVSAAWRYFVVSADLPNADSWLCGASVLFEDISLLLAEADAISPGFKTAYAAEYLNQTKRKLLNPFWDRDNANYDRVLGWLFAAPPGQELPVPRCELS